MNGSGNALLPLAQVSVKHKQQLRHLLSGALLWGQRLLQSVVVLSRFAAAGSHLPSTEALSYFVVACPPRSLCLSGVTAHNSTPTFRLRHFKKIDRCNAISPKMEAPCS